MSLTEDLPETPGVEDLHIAGIDAALAAAMGYRPLPEERLVTADVLDGARGILEEMTDRSLGPEDRAALAQAAERLGQSGGKDGKVAGLAGEGRVREALGSTDDVADRITYLRRLSAIIDPDQRPPAYAKVQCQIAEQMVTSSVADLLAVEAQCRCQDALLLLRDMDVHHPLLEADLFSALSAAVATNPAIDPVWKRRTAVACNKTILTRLNPKEHQEALATVQWNLGVALTMLDPSEPLALHLDHLEEARRAFGEAAK